MTEKDLTPQRARWRRLTESGLCGVCGKSSRVNASHCSECRDNHNKREMERWRLRKKSRPVNHALSVSLEDRFWLGVDNSSGDESCWPWLRSKTRNGYGVLSRGYKERRAHRFSWTISNGPIPPGMHVLHRCDNPACCNPRHLFVGTHRHNMDDKVLKGRQLRGASHPGAKLSDNQVMEIRKLYDGKTMSNAEIAERYGIEKSSVRLIGLRRTWRHIQ